MKKNIPLVSVIIPTRDRLHLLKEALESVLSQTYRNLEAIVINDGGEDVSQVLSSFRDKRILCLRHEKGTGVSAARNTGLKMAQGKYIAYLDDDDIYYPNHIETLVTKLEETGYMIGYSDAYQAFQIWDGGRFVTIRKQITFSQEFDRESLLVKNYIPVLSLIHRRECLDRIGRFDEGLCAHEDWELWIRMSMHFDFLHVKEVTAEFRTREGFDSITSRDVDRLLDTMKIIHKRYSHFVSDPMTRKAQEAIVTINEKRLAQKKITITPLVTSSNVDKIDERISVVIPVRFSGNSLAGLIETIRSQRRVSDVEIIVVAHRGVSGLSSMPRNCGVRIVDMPDGGYNHGRACNIGMEEARGRYVVFTTDGAMPVNRYWLYSMVKPFIVNPELDALSARRFSTHDGNISSFYLTDACHNRWFKDTISMFLNSLKDDDWIFFDTEVKKRFAYIDLASACIKKDVFSNLEFSPLRDHEYVAIDFGRRLLERGLSSGTLTGTGVYFSDEHDIDYLLKQEYFRAKYLYLFRDGLPNFFEINGITWDELVSDIFNAYTVISDSLDDAIVPDSTLCSIAGRFLKNLKKEIRKGSEIPSLDHSPDDGEAKQLWRLLCRLNGRAPDRAGDMNLVIPDFVDPFRILTDLIWGKPQRKQIYGDEFISYIYKILAMVIGELIGAYICEATYLNRMTPELKEIDDLLLSDVLPSQTIRPEAQIEGICL